MQLDLEVSIYNNGLSCWCDEELHFSVECGQTGTVLMNGDVIVVMLLLLLHYGRRSKHEDISLVPIEQFYDEATEDISKPVSSVVFL